MWIAVVWIAVCSLAGFTVWLLHDIRALAILAVMLLVEFRSGGKAKIKEKGGG